MIQKRNDGREVCHNEKAFFEGNLRSHVFDCACWMQRRKSSGS